MAYRITGKFAGTCTSKRVTSLAKLEEELGTRLWEDERADLRNGYTISVYGGRGYVNVRKV